MFINGKVYNLHISSLTDMFDPELYNVQEQRESSQQFNFFTLCNLLFRHIAATLH